MVVQQRWNYDGVIVKHRCALSPFVAILQHREGSWELGVRRRRVSVDGERIDWFDFSSRPDKTRKIPCDACGGLLRVNPKKLGARATGRVALVD